MTVDTVLTRTLALGAATGSRSMTGLAAVSLTADPGSAQRIERGLAHPVTRLVLVSAALVELVGDKLPNTPSRLQPPGLAARVLAAAGCGVVLTRRRRSSTACSVVVGTMGALGAALATSFGGARWRAWSAARVGKDWPGAAAEDLVAIALAGAATTRSR